jgi:hypothetical protein
MFRNERYFDKNDSKKNYFGQIDDDILESEDASQSQSSKREEKIEPDHEGS